MHADTVHTFIREYTDTTHQKHREHLVTLSATGAGKYIANKTYVQVTQTDRENKTNNIALGLSDPREQIPSVTQDLCLL